MCHQKNGKVKPCSAKKNRAKGEDRNGDPSFPTPDHYLFNLITMTSSEAKRLWRRSIKEHLIVNAFIVENPMNYMNLHLTTSTLVVKVEKIFQAMLSHLVGLVIRQREVVTGYRGCETTMVLIPIVNNSF